MLPDPPAPAPPHRDLPPRLVPPRLDPPPHLALPVGAVAGRVSRVDRAGLDVLTGAGTVRLRPPAQLPGATVGDWLAIGPDGRLELLPRSSLLARRSASRSSEVQPLAANVDLVLVCVGLHARLPERRLERLLTLSWDSGATPVLVLTKADLCGDVPTAVELARRQAPGVDVVVVSAAAGQVSPLAPYTLPGTTLVLIGASGTGKSTVVNALAGRELMAVGQTRQVDGKGRHTTTHRELLVLPGGAVVIDTPGLRAVAVQGGEQGLSLAFGDIEDLAAACRFADCGHDGEPGCAVLASVEAGDIDAGRIDSWRRLQRELAFQARRRDARLRSEDNRRAKAVFRAQRARGGRP